jgi:hypothetical protein
VTKSLGPLSLADLAWQGQAVAGRGRTADQLEVRPYAGWALVTCRVATTRNADGTPGGGNFWNTRVFVRDPEGWRCAAWQATKISEP